MPPADGVSFIAGHLSRAETLSEWLDPSVRDEVDPDNRDPALDIYAPEAVHKPPYSAEFVRNFRAAQLARNRKITARVRELLDRFARKNDAEMERGFVVHRTNCDIRWLDPAVDPNGRKPGWGFLGDPPTPNPAPPPPPPFPPLPTHLSTYPY